MVTLTVAPVNYFFEDDCAYIHSLPGQKIAALRAYPRACLQVDEIEDICHWRSVLAVGNFEELTNPDERTRVLNEIFRRFPTLTPIESTATRDAAPPSIIVFRVSNAGQVLDLIIRARDIHHISGLFVTKTLREIPYLATHYASKNEQGEITVSRASGQAASKMKVILLEEGEIGFVGTHDEFANSSLPAVTRMTHAENGTHFSDIHFSDPWSKRRKPREKFL